MDGVEVEPLGLGGDEYVFVIIELLVRDVGVDGEILLGKFWIGRRLLLGRE
jgi:hypothetical protein